MTARKTPTAKGRRVYLGNPLYLVKPYEIEDTWAANGFQRQYDAIQSATRGIASSTSSRATRRPMNALSTLGGVRIQEWPVQAVKVGPCRPKGAEKRWNIGDYEPTFRIWEIGRAHKGPSEKGTEAHRCMASSKAL